MTGTSPSWVLGTFWFSLAILLIVFAIWFWDKTASHHWKRKGGLTVVVLLAVGIFSVKPVVNQYRAEHAGFRMTAKWAMVGWEAPSSSHIIVVFELKNRGVPSSISPSTWHFELTSSDGTHHNGELGILQSDVIEFCLPSGLAQRFAREDWLVAKTQQVISTNGIATGFLAATFDDVSSWAWTDARTVLQISAMDATGGALIYSFSPATLRSAAMYPMGMRYPIPISSPSCPLR
ncbi:MAG: hypothetical protein ABSF98_19020 [Bryobacteraceae bacterium]